MVLEKALYLGTFLQGELTPQDKMNRLGESCLIFPVDEVTLQEEKISPVGKLGVGAIQNIQTMSGGEETRLKITGLIGTGSWYLAGLTY